ncbi:PorV/PorQ family protein [bacterium]|nr:PorV/PorQ family protein [bacterium]
MVLRGQYVKYSGEFLATGAGARALAMGGAFTAVSGDVTSVYWNPAGLVTAGGIQIHAMHSERFAGAVNRDFIGTAVSLSDMGVFAAAYYRLGVDGIPLTRLQNPDIPLGAVYIDEDGRKTINDPYVYRRIDNVDHCFVFSYGKRIGSWMAFGASAKIIRRTAEIAGAWGIGFDAGLICSSRSGLSAGLMIRDLTTTAVAWEGSVREVILPTLSTGCAYTFRLRNMTVLAALDAGLNIENRDTDAQLRLGRAGVEINAGLEWVYSDVFALRAGMTRSSLTAGAGFSFSRFTVDYGFSPHADLGNTHRVSATIHLRSN